MQQNYEPNRCLVVVSQGPRNRKKAKQKSTLDNHFKRVIMKIVNPMQANKHLKQLLTHPHFW